MPSSYTADTAANLIKDIDAANNAGGANTITLAAATTAPYVLTAVDNTTDGATGLPVIANNDNLTIVGSGDTVERSTVSGTPGFRLLDVAAGASLTLQNLTLQNGQAHGADPAGDGGAAYNQGTLVLNGVTVQNNGADAGGGIYSAGSLTLEAGSTVRSNVAPLGGGIYSTGVLTLEGGTVQGNSAQVGGGIYSTGVLTLEAGTTVQDNHAQGVNGYPLAYQYYGYGYGGPATPGGNGLGGGIYVAGGTAALSNATLFSNTATGGKGGWGGSYGGIYGGGSYSGAAGGSGLGGALAVSGGNVSLTSVTMSSNAAQGGPGGFAGFVQYNPAYLWRGGNGLGGAVEVSGGTVILTTVTLSANTAQGGAGGTGVYGYRSVALGGYGGTGFGGALGVSGGTVISQGTASLTNATVVAANTALGGAAGPGLRIGHAGAGGGGGTYIASTATTYLDSSTVAGTSNNTDATGTNGSTANIDGTNTAPSTYLQPPTVANAASATPSAVTGSTTSLSVLGNDPNDGNESYLSYTWIVTSAPAGAATPTFASNGTNASKSTTATFYRAGNYTIKVTLSDSYKLTTDSSVNVIVSQTATSISVSPVSVTMPVRSQQPFQATTFDQFGQPMTTQPSGYTWSIAGGGIGSIYASGQYNSPNFGTGSATIQATTGGITGTATVTIQPFPPVITQPDGNNQITVTRNRTELQAQASDPQGSTLSYAWSVTYQPDGAATPTFNNANTQTPKVTFYQAGDYTFTVTVTDTSGQSAMSYVYVYVAQTFSRLSVTPGNMTLADGATQQFAVTALDQFGQPMDYQPATFTWHVKRGGGTVSTTGLYTAPADGTGNFQVRASAGGKYAEADVTVDG